MPFSTTHELMTRSKVESRILEMKSACIISSSIGVAILAGAIYYLEKVGIVGIVAAAPIAGVYLMGIPILMRVDAEQGILSESAIEKLRSELEQREGNRIADFEELLARQGFITAAQADRLASTGSRLFRDE